MMNASLNKNYSFKLPKFEPNYTDQICEEILKQLKIDYESGGQEKNGETILKFNKEEIQQVL